MPHSTDIDALHGASRGDLVLPAFAARTSHTKTYRSAWAVVRRFMPAYAEEQFIATLGPTQRGEYTALKILGLVEVDDLPDPHLLVTRDYSGDERPLAELLGKPNNAV